jgi:hypothetical protein
VEGAMDTIEPVPVIIIEGILVFYFPEIRVRYQENVRTFSSSEMREWVLGMRISEEDLTSLVTNSRIFKIWDM